MLGRRSTLRWILIIIIAILYGVVMVPIWIIQDLFWGPTRESIKEFRKKLLQ